MTYRPLRRWLGVTLVATVILGLAISWRVGSAMTEGHPSDVPPAKSPAQDLIIETDDHVSIAATFVPGRTDNSPAVLLLHARGGSRASTAKNASWLSGLGYATLTIDFRGHGQSTPRPRSFGLNESLDAQAAFQWLKRRQHDAAVAVIGSSLGGAASLIGNPGPLPAEALVLQAVYPDIRHAMWNRIASRLTAIPSYFLEPLLSFQTLLRFGVWPARFSPLAALRQYEGPVLVIGGKQDEYTPPSETQMMFNAAKGPHELWLVPDGDHAAICDLDDPVYRAHIEAFLAKTIGSPG